MKFIYEYKAVDGAGNPLTGAVFAISEDEAYGKVKKLGLKPQSISINWNASVSYITDGGFNTRELINFYRQMGMRLKKADNIDGILRDSANFISDPALKLAIVEAANHRGKNLGERLALAGFDKSESEAIGSAMSEGGKNGYKIFETLSNTKKRNEELKAKTSKLLRTPIAMLIMLYAAIYGALVFLSPMMLKFMKYQGIKLSDMMFLEPFYRFSIDVQGNLILFNVIYGLIPIAAVLLYRSKAVVDFFTNWGSVAKLKEINSMIMLWSQFYVLYQANIGLQQITKKVAGISDDMRFRLAFNNMGRKLADGKDIADSIMMSDFPNYVRLSLSAAAKGDLEVGISDMLEALEIDQAVLFERIEATVGFISKVIGVLVVGTLFAIVMVPQLLMFKSMAS